LHQQFLLIVLQACMRASVARLFDGLSPHITGNDRPDVLLQIDFIPQGRSRDFEIAHDFLPIFSMMGADIVEK